MKAILSPKPGVMGEAIVARLNELATLTDEDGALTRLYLSPAHRRAADLVMQWMRAAGMSARVDAVGNVVGRYEADRPQTKTLLLGSHIDTVRDAGKYDGNLGVVAAIEIVATLRRAGRRPPFAIEVVAFGDEEGVRFASALGGSRALAGLFDPATLEERDAAGVSRREALESFGCNPSAIGAETRAARDILGYVELHIEQGPVLESEQLPVGVVTAINGASRGRIAVVGESAHAGAVPMKLRHDALIAAAEMELAIERRALAETDLVATIGQLEISHPATNTIPGSVAFTLDVRAPDDATRKAAIADIVGEIETIARRRGLSARAEIGYEAPAAPCDAGLSARLVDALRRLGFPARRMPSGAGHDPMGFGGRIPFAMLFVRCKGGVSHNPAEYASPEDIDIGARALLEFVEQLALEQA